MYKYLIVLALLCPALLFGQAQPPVAYQPQLITYPGVPQNPCQIYQVAENVATGQYYNCLVIGGQPNGTWQPLSSTLQSGLTGQVETSTNGVPQSPTSPSIVASINSPVSTTPYTIQCDDNTTNYRIVDRGHTIHFATGASVINVPLSTTTSNSVQVCAGLATTLYNDQTSGLLTVQRAGGSTDTFTVYTSPGTAPLTGQTSFTFQYGQTVTLAQESTGVWTARLSGGGGGTSTGVNPLSCSTCTDSFGIVDLKEIGVGSSTTDTLLGSRYNQGDTVLLFLVNYGVSTALTVNSITSGCGATFSTTPKATVAAGSTWWIGAYEAFNTPACQSDKITVTTSAAATNGVNLYSVTCRYCDNASDPYDVSATGNGTAVTTTSSFSTTNANDIIIAFSTTNNTAACNAMNAGLIGGVSAVSDGNTLPLVWSTSNCAISVLEHLITTTTQSGITASTTGGNADSGIIAIALRRLVTPPNLPLTAKFDGVTLQAATWSSNGTTITPGSGDPILAACNSAGTGHCGETLYAAGSTAGQDGNTTGGSMLIKDTVISSINGAGVITIRDGALAANNSANSDGFTGWVNLGWKDTDALRAAFKQAVAQGVALNLPCGKSLFDGWLFQNITGHAQNNSIMGCGMGQTILVPTFGFNFHPQGEASSGIARPLGVVYYDQGCQLVGPGNNTQQATSGFLGCQLNNWSIWGATQPGTNYNYKAAGNGVPLPYVYLVRGTLNHWSCGSWNPAFGASTNSDVPGLVLAGSDAYDSSVMACGNTSVTLLQAPISQLGSHIHGGFWGYSWGASLNVPPCSSSPIHSVEGATISVSDFSDHTVSLANNNMGLNMTGCLLRAVQSSFVGGGQHAGGTLWLVQSSMFTPSIAPSLAAFNVVGGTAIVSNSLLQGFNMTSGTMIDNCNVSTTSSITQPYTMAGTYTFSGGTIINSCSITGTPVTGNFALTNATFTSAAGDQKHAQLNITASANAAITIAYTFPNHFANVPVCSAQDVGGTNPILTFTNSVAPTTTAVTFLSTAAATNTDTLQIAINCQ